MKSKYKGYVINNHVTLFNAKDIVDAFRYYTRTYNASVRDYREIKNNDLTGSNYGLVQYVN